MNQRSFHPPKVKRDFPRVCPICGGSIKKTNITLSFPDSKGVVRIVQGVPAGVCESCGEEYLTAEVSATLERILDTPPDTEVNAPVWKYAANL